MNCGSKSRDGFGNIPDIQGKLSPQREYLKDEIALRKWINGDKLKKGRNSMGCWEGILPWENGEELEWNS